MVNDIKLYLCKMPVDFKTEPAIYYNFTLTDTTAPTAVKNSFSKTLEIEGTDTNNAIFGQIWDLSRFQEIIGSNGSGTQFNPLKKAEFELYYNGALYETGYFKLTEIKKKRGKIFYNITLYGGLGEYFANLSYGENGEKKEFSDMLIPVDYSNPTNTPDLDFIIDKETVKTAWDAIVTGPQEREDKFKIINFAPCYNGIPENFSANKVLINEKSESVMQEVFTLSSWRRYGLGTSSREMTEWETFDLRSYLQRPVVSVKSLIGACCLPENNGGFEIELDNEFFNEQNPYYGSAYMTLPLLRKMAEGKKETETEIEDGELVPNSPYYTNQIWRLMTDTSFSDFNNLNMNVILTYIPDSPTTANTLYTSYDFDSPSSPLTLTRWAKNYTHESCYLIQVRAYNSIHELVGASDYYALYSNFSGHRDLTYFADDGYKVNKMFGQFEKINGQYVWCNENHEPTGLNFRLVSDNNFTSIEVVVKVPWSEEFNETGLGNSGSEVSASKGAEYVYTEKYTYYSGAMKTSDVRTYRRVTGKYGLELQSLNMLEKKYEDFFSGTKITKRDLLTFGFTPAEFLLSYCKMFGLYFIKDPYEKKITITDRTGFFDRNKIIDINNLVDRDMDIKITPSTADKKYYDFPSNQIESEAATGYNDRYGQEYGMQRINTGYNFDNESEKVYEGVFNGGVQCLESSPYYYKPYEGVFPVWLWNGFDYNSYSESGTIVSTPHTINPLVRTYTPINPQNSGYDLFNKVQLHKADNEAIDGEFILLFHSNEIDFTQLGSPSKYWLTDDTEEMAILNNNKPCWIFTPEEYDKQNKKIAIEVEKIPLFSRQIDYPGTGYITHTWDFGKPLETYIPSLYPSDGMSIYEKCWKSYISDIYDSNARKVSCNVLFKERISLDSLRCFYWWDNSNWILTKVTDWNPAGTTTTLCEFVKIKNLNDFYMKRLGPGAPFDFYFPNLYLEKEIPDYNEKYYSIAWNEGEQKGMIRCEDGDYWTFADGEGGHFSIEYENGEIEDCPFTEIVNPDYGYGNKENSFHLPNNVSGMKRTFRLSASIYSPEEQWATVYIEQPSNNETNKVFYVSRYGTEIEPTTEEGWGSTLNDNVYGDSYGYLQFATSITGVPNDAYAYVSDLVEVTIPRGCIRIGDRAFRETSLRRATIPDTVERIGFYAFYGTDLTHVTIPDSVTWMGVGAFIFSKVEELRIGAGLESVPDLCFNACQQLQHVEIPATVTSIGSGAFNLCESLREVVMESPVPPEMVSLCFEETTCSIVVPSGSGDDYRDAYGWSEYADRIIER